MPDIAGLKLIVPTSVAGSGVSVSASGKVTFTSATSVSVNGCFTSTYDNYLMVIRSLASSSGVTMNLRLRSAGTDATGTNYTHQYIEANGSAVNALRTSSDNEAWFASTSNTNRSGAHLYLYGPYLSQPTAGRGLDASGLSSAYILDGAFTHSLSTSYDGITIFPNSGDITGALTIYGLSQ